MTYLIVIISFILLLQIGLFLWGRHIRKKEKENSVLEKYNIRTRSDAWKTLSDPDLPEEDRKKIQSLYEKED